MSDRVHELGKLTPGTELTQSLRAAILATYGPSTTVHFRRFASRKTVYAPFKPSLERVRDAWRHDLSVRAREYDHLIVLRPDASLAAPINLVSLCAAKPGFNIVSDQDVIPGRWQPAYFHSRNWDFMWIACAPSALGLWLGEDDGRRQVPVATNEATFEASRRHYLNCSAIGPRCPPPFPVGELSGPSDNGVCSRPLFDEECRALAMFAREGVRIGSLDSLGIFSFLFGRSKASNLEYLGCT